MFKPFIAIILIAAPAAALALEKPNRGRDLMLKLGAPGLTGEKLEKAITKAERQPLGSADNPVRENMPEGQRAYLARLRCAGGEAPEATRQGNIGTGVYGYTVDLYVVTCPGAPPVQVHMDMYHDGPEDRPVPGFTIVGGQSGS